MLDFDGTVTQKDIGDEVCDRFAAPEWREIDARWVRNEISLPDAQREMWALARCSREEAIAYSRDIGHLRAGLDDFLERAPGPLWLASGGFDFYIEAILGDRLKRFERTFFNRTRFVNGGIELDFHQGFGCSKCAVCKGLVCDLARAQGAEVMFIGDGSSDRCAIGRADRLCAVEGSTLARGCEARGIEFRAFQRFDELL